MYQAENVVYVFFSKKSNQINVQNIINCKKISGMLKLNKI